jgi:AbrB family transcriptional regulator (stage V sporulation protein T)
MKATGIVRRIDDLGRVVIPKEIRRVLRIREGDPLEIYTDHDGEVIFKKYSPVGELHSFAASYAETLNKSCSLSVVITDRDAVIAAAGLSKKEYVDSKISSDADSLIESRSTYTHRAGEKSLYINSLSSHRISVLVPILLDGDIIGSVATLTEGDSAPTETEIKLLQTAANFLSKQLED